jgi:RHS repeat-associated protein
LEEDPSRADDAVGNLTVLQDSLGGTTTSIYDVANRLTTREFGGSGQTPLRINMSYTVRNQLATETRYSDLAGTQTVGYSTLTYDAESRLINLDHQNGSGTNLANYTYGYDLANRLTTETLNGGTPTTYSYDKTNQLTNDSQVAYTYDLNGNRTMTGYGSRGNNELTSDPTYGTYLYDAEGSMAGRTNKSTGEVWSFGYDNMDHMVSAKDVSSTGTTLILATYLYDVFGNRIEKDVWQTGGSTTTTRFAWDNPVDPGLGGSGNMWADLNGSNGLVTRYILGDSLDQLIARISSSGTAAWFLADRLGSVRNITDNSGSLIDTITYDGFGNIMSESQTSNGGRFKYTARESDSETGLQFNRARYYDPKTGRWTSQDPMRLSAGDANLYRYIKNGPTLFTDPSGLLVPLPKMFTLEYRVAEPITPKINGGFEYKSLWKIDPATPNGGYIIQVVNYKWKVEYCKSRKEVNNLNIYFLGSAFNTGWYPYLEAWHVSKNLQYTDEGYDALKKKLKPPYDDLQQAPGFNAEPTEGVLAVLLKAKYYDNFMLPKNFVVRNPPTGAPPTGLLPAVVPAPNAFLLPGGNSKVVVRAFLITWCSCDGPVKSNVLDLSDLLGALGGLLGTQKI